MIGFYDYTVVLTYLSLSIGICGIFNCINGNSFLGILCLLLCGLCDMFDGKVARTKKRNKEEKDFGIQIDSLSDLICFGLLPIVIGYSIGLDKNIYIPVFILYTLCALIRLAYFNVLENVRQKNTDTILKEYTGLPVTSVALIIPFIYIFKCFLKTNFMYLYLITIFIISILFISKIKIKKPSFKIMLLFILVGLVELVFILKFCHII